MKILCTGGAGFIGSHTAVELLNAGHEVVIADNLYNADRVVIDRIAEITGKTPAFYEIDVCDQAALSALFEKEAIDAVIHFAGYKAVGESVEKPLEYYTNNLNATLVLCDVMRAHGCKTIVFSSSATVYGDPAEIPITEQCPLGERTNPYGESKAMQERILTDLARSDPSFQVTLLRYFNPIGAHESGRIGEDPKGIPNNLLPYVARVAAGSLKEIHVFGTDYDTPDGTGVRDYIHVCDLAKGHVAALAADPSTSAGTEATEPVEAPQNVRIYNLGTGKGYSVLEVIKAFEKACGKTLPFVTEGRRAGDIAVCYADPAKAKNELHWTAEKTLDDMCKDAWRWQSGNPDGYRSAVS
ncbi:MAG: UDP-glucose 4-epimerase GalE [Lachnospiraceae bacterium]|nr:UDP-glucose 4-epimerase GalE [Lachnospiraceae bacterium]